MGLSDRIGAPGGRGQGLGGVQALWRERIELRVDGGNGFHGGSGFHGGNGFGLFWVSVDYYSQGSLVAAIVVADGGPA